MKAEESSPKKALNCESRFNLNHILVSTVDKTVQFVVSVFQKMRQASPGFLRLAFSEATPEKKLVIGLFSTCWIKKLKSTIFATLSYIFLC